MGVRLAEPLFMMKRLEEFLRDRLRLPRSQSSAVMGFRPPAVIGLSMCPDWPVPHQGLISRGYSYTLQRNNGESWDLTDSAGNKLTAPAVCFMIPPTDPEALALAERYGVKEEELVWCVAAPPWLPGPIHSPGHHS